MFSIALTHKNFVLYIVLYVIDNETNELSTQFVVPDE